MKAKHKVMRKHKINAFKAHPLINWNWLFLHSLLVFTILMIIGLILFILWFRLQV